MNLADRAANFVGKGIKEIAGPTSHPQILDWLQRCEQLYPTDIPLDDSKYAWCGVFVGCMVLDERLSNKTSTLPPPPKYFQGAKRWLNWSEAREFNKTKRGDVAILSRGRGLFHVAIVANVYSDGLGLVGGNQSDEVNVTFYPWTKVKSIRRGA